MLEEEKSIAFMLFDDRGGLESSYQNSTITSHLAKSGEPNGGTGGPSKKACPGYEHVLGWVYISAMGACGMVLAVLASSLEGLATDCGTTSTEVRLLLLL